MKNQQRKLSRLLQENNIENNKQALKAIQICRELISQMKILNNRIKRFKKL